MACRVPGAVQLELREGILIWESVAPAEFAHHHHTMSCDGCGQWWFDDVVVGGLGLPVSSRRDTELCACAEDLAQYRQHVIHVPLAERDCACTRAQVEKFSLPIPVGLGGRGGGAMADNAEPVPSAAAAHDIAAHVGDQDAFIVAVPPAALADISHALRKVSGATCYLDCGLPAVIRVRSPHLRRVADMARSQPPGTACAVFIIPKTLPATKLQQLLGSSAEIPADGSQDLVMIQTRDRFDLPGLLVDALGELDPLFAAQMYASNPPN